MPPLNHYKDQVDYSSYYAYPNSKPSSRFASPFDEDSLHGEVKQKPSQPPSAQPLFLNFTADLNPHHGGKKPKAKKNSSYKVNGVNILNRKSIDSSTALERLQKRRENHNSVERKRRDNINATIMEISKLLPGSDSTPKSNKGNILKLAADYIKINPSLFPPSQQLKSELRAVKNEVRILKGEEPLEEEAEEVQEARKRKSTVQESSDDSEDDNDVELGEKEGQGSDNEEEISSSEQMSPQASLEPETPAQPTNDSKPKEMALDDSPKHNMRDEVKLESTAQILDLSKPVIDMSHTDQPSIAVAESVPNKAPFHPDPDSFGYEACSSSYSNYPILGGSKRFRADCHTLPGMAQFASMSTITLSHMHTLSAAAPRNTPPVSPFGFQLPAPNAPLPSTNNPQHFVSHGPSPHNHQLPASAHSRGPPHMMFREYNGSMNMY
ncbi:hypothetical protein K493DRAFT_307850 [Basidiobolus meristosporus CBS 931.73]|uniref:BHLH domain-containing protein n=1 Tax=Basidiobolus meristosporus CBS 931.73 TaxID=1314790 RepID=A0A1Y1X9A9_9FUNG|nr:hypothetical protein K493DRAFT_307850 [Basidiobolus meristosporus CBS 931.73]|eukprot:ORX82308.1 hypothetical protein K493DRAFT_307850 [Basidiobolus meristosporus CBS 931.73]